MYLDVKRSGDERMWNPATYLQFATERARPFFDLLSRVQADSPDYVVDLGCGPGNLTAVLAARWPAAHVLGVDNSAAMIETARAEAARATGRRAYLQRGAAVGAGTSAPADHVGQLAGAGRLAGVPASRQLRPAQSHDHARAGRVGPLAAAAPWRATESPGRRASQLPRRTCR